MERNLDPQVQFIKDNLVNKFEPKIVDITSKAIDLLSRRSPLENPHVDSINFLKKTKGFKDFNRVIDTIDISFLYFKNNLELINKPKLFVKLLKTLFLNKVKHNPILHISIEFDCSKPIQFPDALLSYMLGNIFLRIHQFYPCGLKIPFGVKLIHLQKSSIIYIPVYFESDSKSFIPPFKILDFLKSKGITIFQEEGRSLWFGSQYDLGLWLMESEKQELINFLKNG